MSMQWQLPALVALVGYLLGSIPFGIILTRLAGAGDLRAIGSGNIGATNVLRTGRKDLAAATLLLDGAKGAVAAMVGAWLMPVGDMALSGATIGGVMAFVGHCYPVWLSFRGGKGVATMLGVCLALSWIAGLVFAAVWLAALALFRISSVGGMSAAISAPVAALLIGRPDLAAPIAGMALVVLWRHRLNIARLLRGEEPRVGSSRAA
ncbi:MULTISPECIES: glycerol-3-phosphate 1-O-acyltransferase PlsY [unclassified Sphingobium]|uniref:glycerol-3-phosphate 1-O-acyltransferase PlsY n=1 Tax=unclassified Sphingobium TaxID=2611147 RepID=UPI0022257BED|nr:MULTISPECIES: glycerol-3-phosphate 1-O-acyltransferase PlsY [unclassified Sphingobium]